MVNTASARRAKRTPVSSGLVGPVQTERPPRISVLLAATLAIEHSMKDVRVHNLSRGGAMIEMDEPPTVGSDVILWRDSIAVGGTVAWVDGDRLGLRFRCEVETNRLFRSLEEAMAWFVPREDRVLHAIAEAFSPSAGKRNEPTLGRCPPE